MFTTFHILYRHTYRLCRVELPNNIYLRFRRPRIMQTTNDIPTMKMQSSQYHRVPLLTESLSQPHVESAQDIEMTPCTLFHAGFMDCAEVALRYLVEVEHLPQNHPMVLGLKCHLYEQQRYVYLKYLFENNLQIFSNEDTSNVFTNLYIATNENSNTYEVITDERIRTGLSGDLGTHSDICNGYEINHLSNNVSMETVPETIEQIARALADEIFRLTQDDLLDDDEDDFDEDECLTEGFEDEVDHVKYYK